MTQEPEFPLDEVLKGQMAIVAKSAVENMPGLNFVFLAFSDDGMCQYTCNVEPTIACEVMADLSSAIRAQGGRPPYRDFQNMLRILHAIDRQELDAAGISVTDEQWARFRDDPYSFTMKQGDEVMVRLWGVIEGRMGGK